LDALAARFLHGVFQSTASNRAVTCFRGDTSKSLREIGELFGGLDYAAVAQRIRRTKATYNPIAARRLITAMLNV